MNEYVGEINIVSSKANSVKFIIQTLVNISEQKLEVEILNKTIQGHDMVFNNQKMIKYLSGEKREIVEGLTEEFKLFKIF